MPKASKSSTSSAVQLLNVAPSKETVTVEPAASMSPCVSPINPIVKLGIVELGVMASPPYTVPAVLVTLYSVSSELIAMAKYNVSSSGVTPKSSAQ